VTELTAEQFNKGVKEACEDIRKNMNERAAQLSPAMRWMYFARVFTALYATHFQIGMQASEQELQNRVIPFLNSSSGANNVN
jgi:hypothetical protein